VLGFYKEPEDITAFERRYIPVLTYPCSIIGCPFCTFEARFQVDPTGEVKDTVRSDTMGMPDTMGMLD
jgi:hypothetical protein